jgi:hypothetical protein
MAAVVPYARLISAALVLVFTNADRGGADRRPSRVAFASDLNFAPIPDADDPPLRQRQYGFALRDAH